MLSQFLMGPRGLAFDRWLVKHVGHSLLNHVFARQAGFKPRPALVLACSGRSSGVVREVALPYFEIDNKLLLVGSRGGLPTDPHWVQNLRVEPKVTVTIKRKRYQCLASVVAKPQRDPLWQALIELVPTYADYAKAAAVHREIPVIELTFKENTQAQI